MDADVLSEEQWRKHAADHAARVRPWVQPRIERRASGRTHPVDDFLFTYYSYRPAQLLTWHPGLGVTCKDRTGELIARRGYVDTPSGVTVDPTQIDRTTTAAWVVRILTATSARPAAYGCFGLHEWAMVYRISADDVRHSAWPLRLAPAEIAEVVDDIGPRCTHFDAFRFFTAEARPLNPVQLTRADQVAHDQPGCLHVTMDLYKWAYKLSPLTASDLVADCFELARDVRTVDMQASPYDLTELDIEPICIETPEGRAEYVERQRHFTRRAEPLRERLLAAAQAISDWPSYAPETRATEPSPSVGPQGGGDQNQHGCQHEKTHQ
jgi:hypothetical protein